MIRNEPLTKRIGKLSLKLFFGVLILKLFIFFNRLSDPFSFPKIDIKINIALLVTFVLSLLFLLPYKKLFFRRFPSNFECTSEDELIKIVLGYIFQLVLLAYLVLLLINEFKTISFNLSYFLIAVIVLGVFTIIFPPRTKKTRYANIWGEERLSKKDLVFIIFISIIGSVLVFIKTKKLGWLSYAVSIVSFLLIFLLSYLIFSEKE